MLWMCAEEAWNAAAAERRSERGAGVGGPVAVLALPAGRGQLRPPLAGLLPSGSRSAEGDDARLSAEHMQGAVPSDGCLSRVRAVACDSRESLRGAVRRGWPLLAEPGGLGLVAVVLSAMLTRGVLPYARTGPLLLLEQLRAVEAGVSTGGRVPSVGGY